MKINKFALLFVLINGLLIALLSRELYSLQRTMQLRTVAQSINQSVFRLEDDLKQILNSKQKERVQSILDRATAINNAVDALSISMDGRVVDFSSSRSMRGNLIGNNYYSISQIFHGLIEDHMLQYKSNFYYFENGQKHNVEMLIRINNNYVFGELDEAAIEYGLSIFLVFSLISVITFILVKRFLVVPLEQLTEHAHTKDETNNTYFIEELTELDLALTRSFKSLLKQQTSLKEALEETQYLDSILRTVADVNQLLISVKDIDELMQESVRLLAAHKGYGVCWIGLEEKGLLCSQVMSSNTAFKEMEVFNMDIDTKTTDNPLIKAFVSGKSVLIKHLESLESDELWVQVAQQHGLGSLIVLPLRSSIYEKSFGVLGLYALNIDGFETKEVDMLEELAGDIGFAIHSFQKRKELEYHLTTDAITSLPNRTLLVDKIAESEDTILAIINIDRFNDINDVYGVSIGDSVLGVYADWLLSRIQGNDNISLYKLSGDEYAVLFEDCKDLSRCKKFMDELVTATSHEVYLVKEIEMTLSITVGIASGFERVIEHATAALKRAKLAHQASGVYIESSTKIEHENNISRYKTIKESIDQSLVVPFFQPIVDNQSGKIVKYEALIRIINKEGGYMSPFSFLDIAKKHAYTDN